MPLRHTFRTLIVAMLILWSSTEFPQGAQKSNGGDAGYTLKLPVDEVIVTFHASGSDGATINDIKPSEIRLWDNGKPPRRVVTFDALLDRPLRVAILLDTSESMSRTLALNISVAELYVQRFFRQKSDQGFVENFGVASEATQAW